MRSDSASTPPFLTGIKTNKLSTRRSASVSSRGVSAASCDIFDSIPNYKMPRNVHVAREQLLYSEFHSGDHWAHMRSNRIHSRRQSTQSIGDPWGLLSGSQQSVFLKGTVNIFGVLSLWSLVYDVTIPAIPKSVY